MILLEGITDSQISDILHSYIFYPLPPQKKEKLYTFEIINAACNLFVTTFLFVGSFWNRPLSLFLRDSGKKLLEWLASEMFGC